MPPTKKSLSELLEGRIGTMVGVVRIGELPYLRGDVLEVGKDYLTLKLHASSTIKTIPFSAIGDIEEK